MQVRNVGHPMARCPQFQKICRPGACELLEATLAVAFHRRLVAHHRHDVDRSKSGESKGTCTGLVQINAPAFNIRPSVRDRDGDGMTISCW